MEVGKWYWVESNSWKNKALICFDNDNLKDNYGFCFYGTFDNLFNNLRNVLKSPNEKVYVATKEEVETALIAEAKRRGFNKTTMITQTFNENQKMCIGFWDESSIEFTRNKLFAKGVRIFDNGKWAEIISKPIELTLEQIAEKFNVNVEQLKIKK